MTVENEQLQRLMQEVDHKIDKLLLLIANQQNEISRLQSENKQLTDNYSKILTQITVYIEELEEIKHTRML
ncbi:MULTISPECIES: hypothetical protein [unclassified Rickettsia]|jgi:chromosome segregation ATPase|uniref:hypothetical protein n=1 Tax=unclassified Rickettsia TaxID=114295 RepID=UPI0020A098EE|nr:hypothetical protein [Rickettsia endosymbiont of Ceutorhynchus assimilis]